MDVAASGAEGKPSKMTQKNVEKWGLSDCHGMFLDHKKVYGFLANCDRNIPNSLPIHWDLLIDAMFCLPFVPLGCGENVIIRLG